MSNHVNVLVAATSPVIAASLARKISGICHEQGIRLKVGPSHDRSIFEDKDDLFSCLDSLGAAYLADTLVILHVGHDFKECFDSRLHSRYSAWHGEHLNDQGAALELILRYPQVLPVFVVPQCAELDRWLACWIGDADFPPQKMLTDWSKLHFVDPLRDSSGLDRVLLRFSYGFRAHFDPLGLRTLVRNRFVGEVFGSSTDWSNTKDARRVLNTRLENLAVVVDEEPDVALISGYAAYKFGARAWTISNYTSLTETESPHWRDPKTVRLTVVRDLDLRFSDYPEVSSSIETETNLRDKLKDIYSDQWRLLNLPQTCSVRALSYDRAVTENSRGFSDESLRLGQEQGSQCRYYGIRKPVKSIHALVRAFEFGSQSSLLSVLPRARKMKNQVGHGAPYQNLRLARELLRQAAECRSKRDVRANIIAALFGQEAYSLLLGMSETSSLEALREVNLGEAVAEGEFAGITHTVGIRGRRNDLENTVRNLQLRDNGANFLARIWAELRLAYKESEQFEASEESNAESLINSAWLKPLQNLGVMEYLSPAIRTMKRVLIAPMRSLGWLLALVIIWPLTLTILHCVVYGWVFSPDLEGVKSFVDLWRHVMTNIIRPEVLNVHGIHHNEDESFLKSTLDLLMSMTSLLFVGLIVTVLFRKSTRG